jgi:hypothetical protein
MQRSVTSDVRSALVVGCLCFVVGFLINKLFFKAQFTERQNEEQ